MKASLYPNKDLRSDRGFLLQLLYVICAVRHFWIMFGLLQTPWG